MDSSLSKIGDRLFFEQRWAIPVSDWSDGDADQMAELVRSQSGLVTKATDDQCTWLAEVMCGFDGVCLTVEAGGFSDDLVARVLQKLELSNHDEVTEIVFENCIGITNAPDVADLFPALNSAQFSACPKLQRVDHLARCNTITELYVENCSSFSGDLTRLSELELELLSVKNCGRVRHVHELLPALSSGEVELRTTGTGIQNIDVGDLKGRTTWVQD